MRIQHHFLGFMRIGDYKHLTAIRQTKVGYFNGLHQAAQQDRFLTPIKLASLASWKGQGDKGLFDGWAVSPLLLPTFHIALH